MKRKKKRSKVEENDDDKDDPTYNPLHDQGNDSQVDPTYNPCQDLEEEDDNDKEDEKVKVSCIMYPRQSTLYICSTKQNHKTSKTQLLHSVNVSSYPQFH